MVLSYTSKKFFLQYWSLKVSHADEAWLVEVLEQGEDFVDLVEKFGRQSWRSLHGHDLETLYDVAVVLVRQFIHLSALNLGKGNCFVYECSEISLIL